MLKQSRPGRPRLALAVPLGVLILLLALPSLASLPRFGVDRY
jgi:hypothetical protein